MNDSLMRVLDAVGRIVLGKEQVIRLSVATVLARGHLLLEDIPGIGKTTLALTLARALGLKFSRIQFTSDLLPADILGSSVFDAKERTFTFRPGPIFHQVVLADEVNRATPKTQSALLEAMGESQVSVEGTTYRLPEPFFVVATQNPVEQYGTFPLPESQLDRFFMSLRMDYPSRAMEKELLGRLDSKRRIQALAPVIGVQELQDAQERVRNIKASDALLEYVLEIVWATRRSDKLVVGISPRGAEATVLAAKAWAYLAGRDYCIPEDVQAVAPAVMRHRLVARGDYANLRREQVVEELIRTVPIP
ncbi:MAG TPA: MoxR family ATPase [Thermoleophilia bacterium]|nr:MoxR family ATPase [Thermoleophilia bacterium]